MEANEGALKAGFRASLSHLWTGICHQLLSLTSLRTLWKLAWRTGKFPT